MNLRFAFIVLVLCALALLLAVGIRTAIVWIRTHYPQRANTILAAASLVVAAAGLLAVIELVEQPQFRPHDLLTLQEPVVAKTIPIDRGAGSTLCVVDVREHLGVLEVDIEQGMLRARVESNNTAGTAFCPIGADVRIDLTWLHRFSVTRRQPQVSGT
ncbi:MAG: hypothetical protein JSR62_01200 [Nitrospira sp.]|nr:hypothetical protein [Nitrospira sp.]